MCDLGFLFNRVPVLFCPLSISLSLSLFGHENVTMKIQVAALILAVLSVVEVSALPTRRLDGAQPSEEPLMNRPPRPVMGYVAADHQLPRAANVAADRHLPEMGYVAAYRPLPKM